MLNNYGHKGPVRCLDQQCFIARLTTSTFRKLKLHYYVDNYSIIAKPKIHYLYSLEQLLRQFYALFSSINNTDDACISIYRTRIVFCNYNVAYKFTERWKHCLINNPIESNRTLRIV